MRLKILIFAFTVLLPVVSSMAQKETENRESTLSSDVLLSYDRYIRPAGYQIVFGEAELENHALDCALSVDEKWLVVQERYSLVFINTATKEVAFRFPLSDIPGLKNAEFTYSGVTWHKEGEDITVWCSASGENNRCFLIETTWDGEKCRLKKYFTYMPEPPAGLALPNEMLFRKEPDGDRLYLVLNGNNQLLKQDPETGDTIWIAPTGVAPYGITMAAGRLYVTNWGGRVPGKNEKNVAGVPWGLARVDPNTGAVSEGSVSVYDPDTGKLLREIVTGLHPNEIISSFDGKYVYLTTSNSDEVCVINTGTDTITEIIPVRLQRDINNYFGDSPNGLGLAPGGKELYVTNGMDNAIAVIRLGKSAASRGHGRRSEIRGFIPTGAYPSSVVFSSDRKIYVTNLEGDGKYLPVPAEVSANLAYNSHHMLTSISIIPTPRKSELKEHTRTVITVNQLSRIEQAGLPPRPDAKPVPVPERTGEPSVFKHVLYIIKENRTYDQVLGDMPSGDGDSTLCVFGEKVTPNAHSLSKNFLLLDYFSVAGKCSAEGHQWTDASIVTDYIEKNMRAWFRSYPHVQTDALVYAPTGFLWDNAVKHNVSVKIYGEAAIPEFDRSLTWSDLYDRHLKGQSFEFTNRTTIDPVRKILSTTFPSYDSHRIPDQLRADIFIRELEEYEKMEGDSLPQLMVMALPNDHTAGTQPGLPTPRAAVADNDLALGRIIEALSHSRFWKETVVLVTEDDSQNGWDHLSPYRTVGIVASPYSVMNKTVHTMYNQQGMVRTIELILGLPPMNIEDAIASPLYDCFLDTPSDATYTAVPNQIPLDELNPPLSALRGPSLHFARQSLLPEFEHIDGGNDDLLNRILWYSLKGNAPYPVKYAGDGKEVADGDE